MKKRNYLTGICLMLLLAFIGVTDAPAKIKVHTIGDSTMAEYDPSSTDKRGWCQMLQQFLDADYVTVNNRGKSGASSKSFYKESAYWQTIEPNIAAGDYVFIQFAHNDEKNGGYDGDTIIAQKQAAGESTSGVDYRGTTASGTFKMFIRRYIDETLARGGHPVIVTPICRKYFSGSKAIRRNGMHDLGDSFGVPESDNTYDYAQSLRDVAAEYNLPVIDLTLLTRDLYLSYGESYCTTNLFCSGDNTHPAALGATLIARLCAQAMKSQGILAEYVNVGTDITISPTSGDLGKAYSGQTVTKEYNISAFGLSKESGTFTFSVTDGFSVSVDKKNYASTASLSYTGGNLIATVYVQATMNTPGIQTGQLTVSDGTVSKTLDLTAECINLSGGEEVQVFWPLENDNTPIVTGPCMAVEESYSNMETQRYAAINSKAVWPEGSGYDASHKTQRNYLTGGAWPAGEIDEVSTRYIQFGMKAPEGTHIDIDRISMYVAGAGGSGMRCKIYYSTHEDFSEATLIQEFASMAGNNAYFVESAPIVGIDAGESIYLRIYPWYSSAATGKTICFADVCIHGMASNQSGITDILSTPEQREVIYDLTGRKLTEMPAHGIVIVNGKKIVR